MSRADDLQAAHDAARHGARLCREPVEDILGTLIEDPSTVEYLRPLGVEHDAIPDLLAVVRAAAKVDEIYEGLRTDANDGEFALWSEDDLVAALHALAPTLAAFEAGGQP